MLMVITRKHGYANFLECIQNDGLEKRVPLERIAFGIDLAFQVVYIYKW